MDMEVLSKLAVVLCADFDETITETTVSVSLFCRDFSREPTQCDRCIKTPLSPPESASLNLHRSGIASRGSEMKLRIRYGGQYPLKQRHAASEWAAFLESLVGNPACSQQTSCVCGLSWLPVLEPICLDGAVPAHRLGAPLEMGFGLS